MSASDQAGAPRKKIQLNAIRQPSAGHVNIGLNRYYGEQSYRYGELEFWIEQAKILERGRFEALFIADVLGDFNVYKGRRDESLRTGNNVPGDDPFPAAAAMIAETRHLGFVITGSTSYELPYILARRFTTLDRLSKGRVGWNIVTSATETAAQNIGRPKQLDHDERYDLADEFAEVTYKLWEHSWEPTAVVNDRDSGLYVDASRVHEIRHAGKYFNVPGIHHAEPSPQRTPVIYQAGTSNRGRDFAAKHAEGVFLTAPVPELLRPIVDDVRARAAKLGRNPQNLKFLPAVNVIVDDTDESARYKYEKYRKYVYPEGGLSRFSAMVGYDLGKLTEDTPLEYVEVQGFRGFLEIVTLSDPNRKWTTKELGEWFAFGDLTPIFVGSPRTVVDEIERWIKVADIDGITLIDYPLPAVFEEFVDFVVPELRRRGLVWDDYEGKTLREYHYGVGNRLVLPDHPAARHSWTVKSTLPSAS